MLPLRSVNRQGNALFKRATMSTLNTGRALSSMPIKIQPSREEISKNRLSWKNLQIVTRALHRDGLVVVENVFHHSALDSLNRKMTDDALYLRSLGENSPFNYNKGNIQQDPPMTQKHFEPSIFINPIVTQMTSAVLGPQPRLTFVSGNTALPVSSDILPQSQPVHSDADFNHPECPFALVVNVPLVDMTVENGSTEVWLGTHRDSGLHVQEGAHGERASGRIKNELLAIREKERPPSQPAVSKGSVIIRDLRLWHAGKPNFSTEPRVMLAMIHFAPWYENPMKVEFADTLRGSLDKVAAEIQIHSTLVPETQIEDGYLNRPFGNAYDFDQAERLDAIF